MSSRIMAKDHVAVRNGVLRCSFCSKAQEEVAKLIAGPEVYICSECVRVCQDMIEQEHQTVIDSTPPAGDAPVSCSLCGMLTLPLSALLIESRGILCPVCLEAVRVAVAARDERGPES